ncbi:MmcQ/YjbR family DNA-binding protein [Maricaulis sp. CAU 1757]
MDQERYNAVCGGLPHTTHVVQWGGSDVWKVGGKVFAVAGWAASPDDFAVSFKCSATTFDMYRDAPGVRPAPYLASRGMTWLQVFSDATLDDDALAAYLAESHRIVAAGLTRKLQRELGFLPA